MTYDPRTDTLSSGGVTDLHEHATEGVEYSTVHDHINNVQDVISHIWSPGACGTGAAITDNGNGTVDVAAGSAVVRVDTTKHGNLIGVSFAAVTGLALTDLATNYIYADYNAGSPQIGVSTDLATLLADGTTALIWAVNRRGTVLNIVDIRSYNVDYMRENAVKDYYTKGIEHANGCEIADLGSMDFSITAGRFYLLNKHYDMPAFDSSTTSFEYVWRSGASPGPYTWNYTSTATGISNDLYNDLTTGTLEAAGNNKFTADNVYAVLNTPGHYKVVYGTQQYDTFADAQAAPPPSVLPTDLDALSTAVFIGKIIIQVGDTANFSEIQSAFDKELPLGRASNHEDLAGLQGGTAGEHNHLSDAELAATASNRGLVTTSAQNLAGEKRFEGGIVIPKASGTGIKVDPLDPSFGYRDITGRIRPDPAGTDAPAITVFKDNVRAYAYSTSPTAKKLDMEFHIPHDYVLGSDLFLHVHWGHNGTDISGSIVFDYSVIYGPRDGVFGAGINPVQTISSLAIGTTPQYSQRVDEIPLSVAEPGTDELLDSDLIEVDGLILVTMSVTTIPTITGGTSNLPFVFTSDIHYQSTNAGTKSKDDPFYT